MTGFGSSIKAHKQTASGSACDRPCAQPHCNTLSLLSVIGLSILLFLAAARPPAERRNKDDLKIAKLLTTFILQGIRLNALRFGSSRTLLRICHAMGSKNYKGRLLLRPDWHHVARTCQRMSSSSSRISAQPLLKTFRIVGILESYVYMWGVWSLA